jgi:hypothetical protein
VNKGGLRDVDEGGFRDVKKGGFRDVKKGGFRDVKKGGFRDVNGFFPLFFSFFAKDAARNRRDRCTAQWIDMA